jgi:Domain of unknown function (DUF4868)
MTSTASRHLKKLKALDLSKHAVSFWLVKRTSAHREATYSVLRVDVEARLQRRFRAYFRDQVQGRDFHLSEYDFSTADGDGVLFTLQAGETDFAKVQAAIENGFDNERAQTYSDLLNSWAYVVLFERDGESVFAWRKINAMTQPRKVQSRKALLFQNHRLTDISDEEVFLIDPHFDFFVYEDFAFIAHKREFESSMNFREGMKAHGGELLNELESMRVLSDVDAIRKHVGDNLHHLRKLASIRKAGYYKQPDYLKRLIEVSAAEGWELKTVDGQIIVEPETIDLLLKLLNNDRLRSPINDEFFDSAAKHPVGKKGAGS